MKRIIFLILFSFVFMSFHVENYSSKPTRKSVTCDTSFLMSKELNDSVLYLALVHYKVKNPKAVLAQAKLESGNFTSSHCVTKNNFLGLYNSQKKEYYKFDHWTDCLLKYKQCFQSKDLNYSTDEEYIDYLLEIGYATDPLYKDKIMRIINNLEYGKEKIST